MTLLEFARGPALGASALIMIAGIAWRLAGILLLPRRPQHAASRRSLAGRMGGGAALILSRLVPRRTFWPRIAVGAMLSTVFHLGLALVVFGGAPHILLVHQAIGLTWPNLPKGLIVIASGLTLAAMIALMVRRLTHPVLRLLSTADDYVSWLLVFLPVLSGILLSGEVFGDYGSLLTLHILSVEALMIWLPFGKLMHTVLVIVGRWIMGMNFARKGAAT